MIQIGTGDWLSCELWTIVISIWNNYRWAERIENRKEVLQYIREAYVQEERKGHPQIAWKLKETVSKL